MWPLFGRSRRSASTSSSTAGSSQQPQAHAHARHSHRPQASSHLQAPGSTSRSRHTHASREPPPLSQNSTPAVPDSLWYASDFLLGAGMVIIQPFTGKCVVVHDEKRKHWFLPKGRKDIGESLEQAALREAYEESGYRAEFMPLYTPTRAPCPPGTSILSRSTTLNTEPIYVHTWKFSRGRSGARLDEGEYITFYYVGQISDDAVHEQNTGMPDEKDYKSYLLTLEQAVQCLQAHDLNQAQVVCKAYELWAATVQFQDELNHQGLDRSAGQDNSQAQTESQQ